MDFDNEDNEQENITHLHDESNIHPDEISERHSTTSSLPGIERTKTVDFESPLRNTIPQEPIVSERLSLTQNVHSFKNPNFDAFFRSAIQNAKETAENAKENVDQLKESLKPDKYGNMSSIAKNREYSPDMLKLLIRHNLLNASPAVNGTGMKNATFLSPRKILYAMSIFSHFAFLFSCVALVYHLNDACYFAGTGQDRIFLENASIRLQGHERLFYEYTDFRNIAFGPGILIMFSLDILLLFLLAFFPYKMLSDNFFDSKNASDLKASRRILIFYFYLTRIYVVFLVLCFLFNFARDADVKVRAAALLAEISAILEDEDSEEDSLINYSKTGGLFGNNTITKKVSQLHKVLQLADGGQRVKRKPEFHTLYTMRNEIERAELGADLGRYTGLLAYFFHVGCYLGLCYAAHKFLCEFDMHMLRRKARAEERGHRITRIARRRLKLVRAEAEPIEKSEKNTKKKRHVLSKKISSGAAPLAKRKFLQPSSLLPAKNTASNNALGTRKPRWNTKLLVIDTEFDEPTMASTTICHPPPAEINDPATQQQQKKISPTMGNYIGQLPTIRGGAPMMG